MGRMGYNAVTFNLCNKYNISQVAKGLLQRSVYNEVAAMHEQLVTIVHTITHDRLRGDLTATELHGH